MQSSLATHLLALLTSLALLQPQAAAQTTSRVSVDSLGKQANGQCVKLSASADGRCVAFESVAANLVPGDTNGTYDIFVHDRTTGRTARVSVDSLGAQADQHCYRPSISADGRFIAFTSEAGNLVPGDTNLAEDVFVHDRSTALTTRVSVSTLGAEGNGPSGFPSISADGSTVAFQSAATTLVLGDTNGMEDVFVHDQNTGQTLRVSVGTLGGQPYWDCVLPSLSADGRFVAFQSFAWNLVSGDSNQDLDVFVTDRLTGITTLVSLDSAGAQGDDWSEEASISSDGRFVSFQSAADNLVPGDTNGSRDVFLRDRLTGQTTRISVDSLGGQANHNSYASSVSADGRFIAFHSYANNLVPNGTHDWNCYVHDRETGQTTLISADSFGVPANGDSFDPSLSADGRFVAFRSSASNLVPGDTNSTMDVFIHDRGPGAGATEGAIVLAGDVLVGVGQSITLSWFAAPPGAFARLLASWSSVDATVGSHPYGVGPGARVIASGFCTVRGTGSFTTAPAPLSALGRTIFFEVAAHDSGGRSYDSNTLERTVQ